MKLRISEQFYSIQGEGYSAGTAAIFLRLQGCNLLCESQHWRCDTIEVWKKGEAYDCEDILNAWCAKGWVAALDAGAHLIITGGEPLLQQDALLYFLNSLDQCCNNKCFVEIESNATLLPSDYLQQRVNQWNLSPKLSNAGMPFKKVCMAQVLNVFAKLPSSYFKFVVSEYVDVVELKNNYIKPFNLHLDHVYIMPAADSKQLLYRRLAICKVWAKAFGIKCCSRLQLQIWDRLTGV